MRASGAPFVTRGFVGAWGGPRGRRRNGHRHHVRPARHAQRRASAGKRNHPGCPGRSRTSSRSMCPCTVRGSIPALLVGLDQSDGGGTREGPGSGRRNDRRRDLRHRHRCRHRLDDRRHRREFRHGRFMVTMVGMALMSLDGRRRDVGDDHHDHRRHQARELPVEVHETWVHQNRDVRNARSDESNPRTGPSVAGFSRSRLRGAGCQLRSRRRGLHRRSVPTGSRRGW